MKWFIKVLRHYADFSGRARRKEYWMFVLFNMIFSFVWILLFTGLLAFESKNSALISLMPSLSFVFYSVALLLPAMAVGVRRLHDSGRSGWMMLVGLIPFIGGIWLLILMASEGQHGENEYGPDPKTSAETFSEQAKLKSAGITLIVALTLSILATIGQKILYKIPLEMWFGFSSFVYLLWRILLLTVGILLLKARRPTFRIERVVKNAVILLLAIMALCIGVGISGMLGHISYCKRSGLEVPWYLLPMNIIYISFYLSSICFLISLLLPQQKREWVVWTSRFTLFFLIIVLVWNIYFYIAVNLPGNPYSGDVGHSLLGIMNGLCAILEPIAWIVLIKTLTDLSVHNLPDNDVPESQTTLQPKIEQPVAERPEVQYDADGNILSIEIKQGSWSLQTSGGSNYYSQNADSLFVAGEILKRLTSIPPQTYYLVDTPDGTLGRDVNGFFTESLIKSNNLKIDYPCGKTEPVQSQSLTGFGNMINNQNSVAYQKLHGQYAKLILMMKCGQCGYESPVETIAGDMERQCYYCGTTNKTRRGAIKVFTTNGLIEV